MKAITLHQPWASWIAAGFKTIETRPHKRFARLAGQRIAIHAGMTWDAEWRDKAEAFLTQAQIAQTPTFGAVRGVIVCTAFVSNHRQLLASDAVAALCPCAGLWGLTLADIQSFPAGVPARGFPGMWDCPDTLQHRLLQPDQKETPPS